MGEANPPSLSHNKGDGWVPQERLQRGHIGATGLCYRLAETLVSQQEKQLRGDGSFLHVEGGFIRVQTLGRPKRERLKVALDLSEGSKSKDGCATCLLHCVRLNSTSPLHKSVEEAGNS